MPPARRPTAACEVLRTRHGIARDGAPGGAVLVSVQLDGTVALRQDGREARLDVGDLAIYDTFRPYALAVQPGTRQLVLKLPREALERRLGTTAAFTARAVRSGSPVGGLASGFLALLPDRLGALTGLPAAGGIAGQALDLVALALSEMAGDDKLSARPLARTAALLRLKSVIEERLGDPALGPALASALAGVGRRYARELFAEEGTTPGRYILDQRLERCRRALRDPAQAGRSVGEVAFAWGFSDPSHFGRALRPVWGSAEPLPAPVRLRGDRERALAVVPARRAGPGIPARIRVRRS